jgi:hypothetical protein
MSCIDTSFLLDHQKASSAEYTLLLVGLGAMPQKVKFTFATADSVTVFETPITLAAKWCGKAGEKNLRDLAARVHTE